MDCIDFCYMNIDCNDSRYMIVDSRVSSDVSVDC